VEPEPPVRAAPKSAAVQKAVRALASAERPIIFAGGGTAIAGASRELATLAEMLGAPVMTTPQARGVIDPDHPLYLGVNYAHLTPGTDVMQYCDVLVAVGTRLLMPGLNLSGKTLIHIDVDPEEIGRNFTPKVAVEGEERLDPTVIQAGSRGTHVQVGPVVRRAVTARGIERNRIHGPVAEQRTIGGSDGIHLAGVARSQRLGDENQHLGGIDVDDDRCVETVPVIELIVLVRVARPVDHAQVGVQGGDRLEAATGGIDPTAGDRCVPAVLSAHFRESDQDTQLVAHVAEVVGNERIVLRSVDDVAGDRRHGVVHEGGHLLGPLESDLIGIADVDARRAGALVVMLPGRPLVGDRLDRVARDFDDRHFFGADGRFEDVLGMTTRTEVTAANVDPLVTEVTGRIVGRRIVVREVGQRVHRSLAAGIKTIGRESGSQTGDIRSCRDLDGDEELFRRAAVERAIGQIRQDDGVGIRIEDQRRLGNDNLMIDGAGTRQATLEGRTTVSLVDSQ
ncbi:MAG: hypothetical protein IIA44_15830, partial [Acidobacteria bacterium]|nr:hypothetical protein [Acidobacteriota bacterium]